MRRIFADAVYWVAIANRKDQWYAKVVTVMRSLGRVTLVTTEEVLTFLAHYSGHGPVLGTSPPPPSKRPWRTRS